MSADRFDGLARILRESKETLDYKYSHRYPTGFVSHPLQKGWELALKAHHAAEPGPSFDLGCGDGMWTLFMASLGRESYGIDIDSTLIRQAKENLRKAVSDRLIGKDAVCRFQAGNFYPVRYHDEFRKTVLCETTETIARWTHGDAYAELGIPLPKSSIIYAYIWPSHMPMAARMLQEVCRRGAILVLPIGGDIAMNHGLRGEVLEADKVYDTPVMLRKA